MTSPAPLQTARRSAVTARLVVTALACLSGTVLAACTSPGIPENTAAATTPTQPDADGSTVIRAGLLVDGLDDPQRDVHIVVREGRIERVGPASGPADYDLGALTVLPGLIDTHVHITSHFGADGRASTDGETPTEAMLFAVENAHATLMAGFTTIQSLGSPADRELRDAIARGRLPGPRILTSLRPITERTGTPDQMRAFVREVAAEGADLIKIFASRSIREGGGRTLSDAQLEAACGEASALGLRSWVHAHADDAARSAAVAGCTAVTHGSQVQDETLAEMARRGTFFEPNIGLVSQNYLANKARFLGVGNYTEEGFAFMEKGIPLKLEMFGRVLARPELKLIMGTDAVAGAHGRNVEEIVYRVETGGQAPDHALRGALSTAAEALGLSERLGRVTAGYDADLIAVDGNPREDIEALRRVVFVMKGGTVFRHVARGAVAGAGVPSS